MQGRIGRVLGLLADPRTPRLPRLAVAFAVLYLLWPADLVPELVLPAVGFLDDLVLLWTSLRWLLRSAPPETPKPAAEVPSEPRR